MKLMMPILTKYLRHGGVSQFVINFIDNLPSNVHVYDLQSAVKSNLTVRTGGVFFLFRRKIVYLLNFLLFKYKLKNINHVLLNPSLGEKSMRRDLYYANICIKKNIPFTIFIHGWDWSFSNRLDQFDDKRLQITQVFNNATAIFVLSNSFRDKIKEWGVDEEKIFLEYTTVNDYFLPLALPLKNNFPGKNILFLARVVKEKGIFETLTAFKMHLNKHPDSSLIIAGDGPDLSNAKRFVNDMDIKRVNFCGFVEGDVKKKILETSDIFILPSYSEGMPICIFEAMAHGQYIISRPVGGIPDYFTTDMGVLVESLNPEDFADALDLAVSSPNDLEKCAIFNHNFVHENCKSSSVATRILGRMDDSFL